MAITAAEAFRDYETDGVPSSGSHKIKKSDMRSWSAWVEGIINAFTANGGLIFSSKATLDASLAHAANTMAWVIGDATVANNGVYGKVGASGSGSWTRRADLPFSFIIASDTGAGTANAIQATTSIPVSGSALVWMNVFEANTASPVTVSFNGAAALTVKTNGGNDVVPGGLTTGMIVMGIVSGSTFRLVSDQASTAVMAAAEASAALSKSYADTSDVSRIWANKWAEQAVDSPVGSNLLQYSEQFDNAYWSKARASIVANATTAPDGSLTADKLVEDTTASNTHNVGRNFTPVADTEYTFSAFVKAGERTFAAVQIGGFGNQVLSNAVYINLATGEFSCLTPSRAKVENWGNGWWRVSTTIRTKASGLSGNIVPSVYPSTDLTSTGTTYTGDGVSGIYIWGAQFEQGAPFASVYVPTTTAAVNTYSAKHWADEAADSAASANVRNVDTRTALKALNTASATLAFLRESGREGLFKWSTGNFSTQITADTAEGIYIKADAVAATVGAWVRQSGWQISGADVRWFGAVIDGATDDAPAINAALSLGALIGFRVNQPRLASTAAVGSTIVLKNGAVWIGDNYLSTVKRLSGHNGALVKTENFDALTGTGNAFAAGVPERVAIDKITFDGNYQNAARTAYVQATGDGLRLFVRKLTLKVRVFNTPGVGVWLECPGGNGPTPLQPGFSREADIEIYTHQTQYEGVIWKGPPDVKCSWILQADAGSRIVANELNGKVSSPTYGAVNGGKCDGVVFDGIGAEVGEIHAFGNYGGGGIDWRGGRINAGLLMAESCHFGGISVSGSASGMIAKLDVHRTGGFGGDTTADFIYAGIGSNNYGVEIASCSVYRSSSSHLGSRNGLEITGDFLDIGVAKVDLGSTATAGHGIYIDNDQAQWITINGGEVARCKGTAPDGLASSGVYRKTTGTGSNVTVRVQVRDCDVGFRSAGTPRLETIDIQAYLSTGQTMFAGDVRTNNGQNWDVRGTINGVWKGSKVKLAATFNSTLTTVQSVVVNHSLIAEPRFGGISLAFVDIGTAINLVDGMPGIKIAAYDATSITVEYKQAVATGSDTVPRVWITAEI